MKINEFVDKVNEIRGLHANVSDDICIFDDYHAVLAILPSRATCIFDGVVYGSNLPTLIRAKLSALIMELLETPIKERFSEKKYRVRLKCFNSDNGHQYLTMEKKLGSGKVFACALRSGVKQEFTPTELNEISNRPQFKSVPWFQEMVKAGIEPVEGK